MSEIGEKRREKKLMYVSYKTVHKDEEKGREEFIQREE